MRIANARVREQEMWTDIAVGVRIVHLTAGHVRLSVEALPCDVQHSLVRHARTLRSVRSATLNSLTGNMLVRFDPATTDASSLIADLSSLLCTGPYLASRREGALLALGSVYRDDHAAQPPVTPVGNLMLPLLLVKTARIIATIGRFPGVQQLLRLILGPALAEALVSVADLVSLIANHNSQPARGAIDLALIHGPAKAPHRALAPCYIGLRKTGAPR